MANLTTIARPYAKAVLAVAAANNSYAEWSKMLEILALLLADARVITIVKNQVISHNEKAEFINSVPSDYLTPAAQNLVKILAYNRRLLVIPEIYRLYELLRKAAQQQIAMTLVTASELKNAELNSVRDLLTKKITGELLLDHAVDASLIGGGKLKIDDRVIDSSIHGRLKALYEHLTQ